ncbi:MAG: hypothetical protein K2K97_11975 [Muribaculaceae bacterium]|nr:hypothetical protein [Muribaculaceae bacterium]
MKTTIFNLIILDESGSMHSFTKETISGCNEILGSARIASQKNPETQRHLVSIYSFCDRGYEPSRYLIKNVAPEEAPDITEETYHPGGSTPLLDAVGSTLTDLEAIAETHEDATGVITIMTDGYENSSTHYDWKDVAKMIERFKEKGWTINLIGANIDIDKMSGQMKINKGNALCYEQDHEGTRDMWESFKRNTDALYDDYACESSEPSLRKEERVALRKSRNFFRL